jgi:uncharacterized protein DUF3108
VPSPSRRHPAGQLLVLLLGGAALSVAFASCRGDRAQPAADGVRRVSVDSGSVSPVPPPGAKPSLSDTGEKKPSLDSSKATQKVPAAAALPLAQVPPVAPPQHTAATLTATPAESAKASTHADSTLSRTASLAPATGATPTTPAPAPAAAPATKMAFGIGEKMDYQVKFGPMSVGSATMEVVGVEQIRGAHVYHTLFNVRGGVPFYKVNDRYESWFDPQSYTSLRFNQNIDEGSYEVKRNYEIFPDRQTYSENGKPEVKSANDPLDEAALIYLLRTMPLEVGKTYDLDRYFKPDRNPVQVQVLRKERVTVPAGTFNTIVVRPIIKTKGMFSEGGHAEVWFTDDSVRTMVQMKSQLKIGSLNLYLKSTQPGTHP